MRINIDLDDPKKIRKYVIILLVLITLVTIAGVLLVGDRKETTQDNKNIEVVDTYMNSNASEDLYVGYNTDSDEITVTYPGYKTIDEIELQMVSWYKENTEYKEITIVYGEIAPIKKKYDLTRDYKELFKNNSLVNAPNSEPLF